MTKTEGQNPKDIMKPKPKTEFRFAEITITGPQVSMKPEDLAMLERAADPKDFDDAMLAVQIEELQDAIIFGLNRDIDRAFMDAAGCGPLIS